MNKTVQIVSEINKTSKVSIVLAQIKDYPCIEKMDQAYGQELSKKLGWNLSNQEIETSFNFQNYLLDPNRRAYLIQLSQEIAGFILLNQATEDPINTWNIGECFVSVAFRGQRVALQALLEVWSQHPGKWEVAVLPQNTAANVFWERVISGLTKGHYQRQLKSVNYDKEFLQRVIFSFDTKDLEKDNLHA